MLSKISKFIAGIIEGRDLDLSEHHQRVSGAALAFAKHIGCSNDETEIITIGAAIHDIGKMSISEHILNKPARLTASEFRLVKQHTELGFELLAPLDLDPRVCEIVRSHHENFDGTGYPEGLSAEEIPLFARMARIWDSYDALTEDRPYHRGIASDSALRVLQEDSHLYDPELLGEFCSMVSGGALGAI